MSDKGHKHDKYHKDRDHAEFDKRKVLHEAWKHDKQNPANELTNQTERRKLAKRQSRQRKQR